MPCDDSDRTIYLAIFRLLRHDFAAARVAEGDPPKPVSFIREVAPILVGACQACHGPKTAESNYRLDTFEMLMRAGRFWNGASHGRESG